MFRAPLAAFALFIGFGSCQPQGLCPEGERPIYDKTQTGFCVPEDAK